MGTTYIQEGSTVAPVAIKVKTLAASFPKYNDLFNKFKLEEPAHDYRRYVDIEPIAKVDRDALQFWPRY